MRASKSRKDIIAQYDEYDTRITVMTFDPVDNSRNMTYSGLGLHTALLYIAQVTARGLKVRIFLDLQRGEYSPRTLQDIPTHRLMPGRE